MMLMMSVSSNEILDIIAGGKTRIRPTYYARNIMTYDPQSNGFMSLQDPLSKFTEIRLNRDGYFYILGIEDSWLCIQHDLLQKCSKPTRFRIDAITVGFKFRAGSQCLAMGKRYQFVECQEQDRKQAFVLEIDKKLRFNYNYIEVMGQRYDITKKLDLEKIEEEAFEKAIKRLKNQLKNPKARASVKKFWTYRKLKFPNEMCY